MATVKLDLVENSQLELASNMKRWRRQGIVTDITTAGDGSDDPEVIHRVQTALESHLGYGFGTTPGSYATNIVWQQTLIRGISNNQCRVELVYETPLFGGPASALIIRDRSYISSVSANTFIDAAGNRRPIEVQGGTFSGEVVKDDYATVTYPKPMRAIQISALTYGAPSNGGQDAVGCVNNSNWKGKPIGYWLLSEFETNISRYSGYYTMQATAITKVNEDWSTWAILRSNLTGKFVKITDTVMDAFHARPYANTIYKSPGVSKIGPHPVANFPAIFGTT